MPRVLGALGIGVVCALLAAIVSLLVAVLLVGDDRAVLYALATSLLALVVATPTAWWLLRARPGA